MLNIIEKILALPELATNSETYCFLKYVFEPLEDKSVKSFFVAVTKKNDEKELPNQMKLVETFIKLEEIKLLLDTWQVTAIKAYQAEHQDNTNIDNDVMFELTIKALSAYKKKLVPLRVKLEHWTGIVESGLIAFYFMTLLSSTKIFLWTNYLSKLKQRCVIYKDCLEKFILQKISILNTDIYEMYFANNDGLSFEHHINNLMRDLYNGHVFVAPVEALKPLLMKYLGINEIFYTLNRLNGKMDLILLLTEFNEKFELFVSPSEDPGIPSRLTLFGSPSLRSPFGGVIEFITLNRIERDFILKGKKVCAKLKNDKDFINQNGVSITNS